MCWKSSSWATYRFALVAVARNVALATAEINTSVLVGRAPVVALRLGDGADRDRAAGNGRVRRAVLRRREAGKGRGGDDEG